MTIRKLALPLLLLLMLPIGSAAGETFPDFSAPLSDIINRSGENLRIPGFDADSLSRKADSAPVDIKAVKLRLQELEYYSKDATGFDERIDADFTRWLKRFQHFNDLPVSGELTGETLAVLLSEDALTEKASIARYKDHPELEPEAVCLIVMNSTCDWESSGNIMNIKFQTTNLSAHRTVTAFELTIHPYDPWGQDMSPSKAGYRISTIKKIKPGEKQYSNRIRIDRRLEIDELYVGVSKIRYSDGSIVEIPENEILYGVLSGPFESN